MTQGQDSLQESIARQREMLTHLLTDPLRVLAEACARAWGDRAKLDSILTEAYPAVPYCKFLYALNVDGIQVSSNISREGLVDAHFGRDRSARPYMREAVPIAGFLLSEAYISLDAQRPSLTAIQIVTSESGAVLGYVGADFALRELPHTQRLYEEPRHWRQIKGDPSIRGAVFHQTRSESVMDKNLDTVISVVEELMLDRGVYHVMLHLSSSRAVVWLMDDPYRYRLLAMDVLMDPDSCMTYPRQPYPADALVPADKIRAVLENFRALRFMDEMFYLRSGTLNIFNGVVGLTFSCDGSHYIQYDEFLEMDPEFWATGQ
ncbi:MAG TPA: PDC sensor domain-containing protein [Acidiferrobacter sp.]|nr:PDC sensor domain-containing protein [Acidiferrobacter sp.]